MTWLPYVKFVFLRLAAIVPIGFGITIIVFTIVTLVPADPAAANLGDLAATDPQIVQAFRDHYGLNKPVPIQYVIFLQRLAHGDLGESEQSHRPVTQDLADYIPATAELAVAATLIVVITGLVLGTLAAMRRNTPIDQLVRIVSLTATSVPPFWLGLIAVYLLFFKLGWFPSGGRLDPSDDIPTHLTGLYTVDSLISGNWLTFLDAVHHLILPALVLATYNIGVLTRFTRAAVLDVVHEDYINLARAKGLTELSVLRHVLRSAFTPVATVIGFLFADVMTGTVLVETIFAWPGIGRYAFHAATTLDLPAIAGITLFVAMVFVTINIAVDLVYGVIDPRLRIT